MHLARLEALVAELTQTPVGDGSMQPDFLPEERVTPVPALTSCLRRITRTRGVTPAD